jgi:hypothetical protein
MNTEHLDRLVRRQVEARNRLAQSQALMSEASVVIDEATARLNRLDPAPRERQEVERSIEMLGRAATE